jgi:hypothetical protein
MLLYFVLLCLVVFQIRVDLMNNVSLKTIIKTAVIAMSDTFFQEKKYNFPILLKSDKKTVLQTVDPNRTNLLE